MKQKKSNQINLLTDTSIFTETDINLNQNQDLIDKLENLNFHDENITKTLIILIIYQLNDPVVYQFIEELFGHSSQDVPKELFIPKRLPVEHLDLIGEES